eukprot:40632-Eustigmatos_ZCMA.PRE.1
MLRQRAGEGLSRRSSKDLVLVLSRRLQLWILDLARGLFLPVVLEVHQLVLVHADCGGVTDEK